MLPFMSKWRTHIYVYTYECIYVTCVHILVLYTSLKSKYFLSSYILMFCTLNFSAVNENYFKLEIKGYYQL